MQGAKTQHLSHVFPAGIAGIQKPWMAKLSSNTCGQNTGTACHFEESDGY
jgi:hypothetical protein